MRLRRKSRKRRLADTAAKFVKNARKTITGLAAYKVVRKAPAPVKALPVVAGVGAAGAVAARKRRQPETTAA
jgi:hypothetical protein